MFEIEKIHALEILDSRGNPTLEVEVCLKSGSYGSFSVPSGASTGEHEACELRDGDSRYSGKGVRAAVNNVNEIFAKALVGQNIEGQAALDDLLIEMDGTPNKKSLGANAILGISLAFAKACASQSGIPLYAYFGRLHGQQNHFLLPTPMMNVINGGAHADNALMVQEMMVIPWGFSSFKESLRCGAEIFHALKSNLKAKGLSTAVGDEGGFAPDIRSLDEALDFLMHAIETAGYKIREEVVLGIDAAASEFYKSEKYEIEPNVLLTSDELISFWEKRTQQYPIVSLEDPLDENDWSGFKSLTAELGNQLQIVGDDLFVTNPRLVERGCREHAANALLVKVNQIGTLTETLKAISIAQTANFATVISHRSGETEDSTIADLAVGTSAGQIKTGSLCRSDRVAKYNQLLRIEDRLGNDAVYAGKNGFKFNNQEQM